MEGKQLYEERLEIMVRLGYPDGSIGGSFACFVLRSTAYSHLFHDLPQGSYRAFSEIATDVLH